MDTATFGWTSPPPPSAGLVYNGVWNAFTNNPFLQSGVGVNGEYYIVSVAGTTDLDGVTDWQVGDWAIFNGTDWQKIDNSDLITGSGTANEIAYWFSANQLGSLTVSTYPSLTELSYVKGVTSPIQTQFANVGEWIQLGGTTFAPVDSTTYNFGLFNQLPPATTTGAREFSFIKTGTVTRFIFTVAMTIAGTAENVAVSLRNITTATDNSIGNITMSAGANGTGVFNFTPSITIANTTDRYTIRFVCPAWVTNPTGVYTSVRLFNKY